MTNTEIRYYGYSITRHPVSGWCFTPIKGKSAGVFPTISLAKAAVREWVARGL